MKNILAAIMLFTGAMLSSCCKEGLTGDATVTANVKHHEAVIYGATVYIKFDSKTQPASLSEYDATFTAGSGEGAATINNLKCGDYFFYATGFDPAIGAPVTGGIPYTIRHGDRKDLISINIPVTE
jgi:hypothetical protein